MVTSLSGALADFIPYLDRRLAPDVLGHYSDEVEVLASLLKIL